MSTDAVANDAPQHLPPLPAGWRYKELGDLLQSNGLSYGIVQPGSDDPDGIPILRVKNIRKGRLLVDDVLKVSKDVVANYQRTRLNGGEVLLSLVGSVGEVAIAPPSVAGWNVARAVAVIRVDVSISSSWIQFCLESGILQHFMSIWQTNTVQATLNLRDVRRLPIVFPPPQERDAIAAVLRALDDKISVNYALSRTTRDLARAYIRAAAESDDSDESELSSVVEFLNRGVTPRYTADEEQLRVLNQKCIRDGRVSFGPSRRTLADKVMASKFLKVNDVLINSTGVGTLGRVARWTKKDACTADSHVTIIRFDEAKVDPVCAGFVLLEMESEIEALGEGSTGQTELSRVQLSALRLTLPSKERSAELRPVLDALEGRGDASLAESESLAKLRDTLLPKLMSGEIRVRDAEKVVEDVTL